MTTGVLIPDDFLGASQDRFQALTDALPGCIWTMRPDGTITYRNRFWLTYSGFPATVSDGQNPDVIHPEDRPLVMAAWEAARRSGEEFVVHCRMRRHDGVYRWHLNRTIPVKDAAGVLVGWIASATDIDNAKRYEETLRFLVDAGALLGSSLEVEATLASIPKIAVPRMADWCSVDLLDGPNHLRRLAFAHSDPVKMELGHRLMELVPSDRESDSAALRVIETGQPELVPEIPEEAIRSAVKNPVALELLLTLGLKSSMVVPLKSRDRVFGVISFVSAESDRRFDSSDLAMAVQLADRAALALDNAQLFAQERRATRNIRFLSSASAVLASSLDYQTTLANVARLAVPELADWCTVHLRGEDGFAKLVALKHEDAEVEAAIRDLHTRFPAPLAAPVGYGEVMRRRTVSFFDAYSDELFVKSARSELHLELLRRCAPSSSIMAPLVANGESLGVLSLATSARSGRRFTSEDLAVVEDLAHRASVALENALNYDALNAERKRAEEANRLKDEFLATVSHELRTPLTAMLGWLQMLRSGGVTAERQPRALEIVERNARAQARLVEDLLDVSRIMSGKLQLDIAPTELGEVIRGALDAVRPAAEAKKLKLATELDAELGPFLGDPTRLQQIIWNLLSNAVKFTPEGGIIDVSLKQSGDAVEIAVADTGAGIPPEFLPHLFEPFRQADASTTRRFGGLGLGLSIARYLVEMHGGSIRATSAGVGLGARFSVRLPASSLRRAPQVGSVPSPAGSVPPAALEGLRVLVVDDEPDVLELVEAILARAKLKVTVVGSSRAALEAIALEPPDVVLTDIGMPEEDGYFLLKQIRALAADRGGHLPVVAMSAYARTEDRARALLHGFQLHVQKPLDPAELYAVLASVSGRTEVPV